MQDDLYLTLPITSTLAADETKRTVFTRRTALDTKLKAYFRGKREQRDRFLQDDLRLNRSQKIVFAESEG